MKAKVYIETSVISYLVARPSRDLLVAAHQQITNEWWDFEREAFDLFVSELVLEEAGDGDGQMAALRLSELSGIAVLETPNAASALGTDLVTGGALPPNAANHVIHIAIAAINEIDYLLTWNCRHLANARFRRAIASRCALAGYKPPEICTPEELVGNKRVWIDPIVEEIRKIRDAHAAKFNYDVHAIFEDLRKGRNEHPSRTG